MEAILKFNLDDPDDAAKHKIAVLSNDLALAVWEFQHNSRKQIEYHADYDEFESNDDLINFIYKKLYDLLDEKGIDIESLTT